MALLSCKLFFFEFSVDIRDFVIGLSQMSFFFSQCNTQLLDLCQDTRKRGV